MKISSAVLITISGCHLYVVLKVYFSWFNIFLTTKIKIKWCLAAGQQFHVKKQNTLPFHGHYYICRREAYRSAFIAFHSFSALFISLFSYLLVLPASFTLSSGLCIVLCSLFVIPFLLSFALSIHSFSWPWGWDFTVNVLRTQWVRHWEYFSEQDQHAPHVSNSVLIADLLVSFFLWTLNSLWLGISLFTALTQYLTISRCSINVAYAKYLSYG